jgi:hypothetical protein
VLERSELQGGSRDCGTTFDLPLDLKFLVTYQLPMSLKELIGEQKNEIYSSLSLDPKVRYRLTGSRTFTLSDGKRFLVFFCI